MLQSPLPDLISRWGGFFRLYRIDHVDISFFCQCAGGYQKNKPGIRLACFYASICFPRNWAAAVIRLTCSSEGDLPSPRNATAPVTSPEVKIG